MYVRPKNVSNSNDLLKAGSSEAIVQTLEGMRGRLRRWERWLTQGHPYKNVVKVLAQGKIANITIDGEKLAEYIAASIPLHAADGWSYLARAFDSIRSGDRNTAVHLAYYAELRAGMSLLASEGVGVFNTRHVAIGPAFAPTVWGSKPEGTHNATWMLLRSWAKDPIRVMTILTAIEVESRTISDWFDAASVSLRKSAVAQEWLTAWSIDLRYFERDRGFRNNISYRPSKISPDDYSEVDISGEVVDPVFRTWDALEPISEWGGAAIDLLLLQRALTRAHKRIPKESWADFLLRLEDSASSVLLNQLTDLSMMEHHVFNWAGDRSRKNPPLQAILARATLLLRIASGVCARRLTEAGVTKEEMKFWWSRFGEDGGLWSNQFEQGSFAHLLWPDVVADLEECEMELIHLDSTSKVYELSQIFGPKVALTQFTRAPLWLLGLDKPELRTVEHF